jgi:hypothetical protein
LVVTEKGFSFSEIDFNLRTCGCKLFSYYCIIYLQICVTCYVQIFKSISEPVSGYEVLMLNVLLHELRAPDPAWGSSPSASSNTCQIYFQMCLFSPKQSWQKRHKSETPKKVPRRRKKKSFNESDLFRL